MIYKGHDLDLRTLQGEGQALPSMVSDPKPGVYKHTFGQQRKIDKTIWVDETAMRLCNQAHDLAATFGAREVELSHLIWAMTQLRATVRILSELNVNVSELRREVASLLVDEKPEISWDGKSSPRKSGEFEDVLRASASLAYKRRSPVSTADIIDTLFVMSRDNPTRKILTRFHGDFALRSDAGAETEEIQPRNGRRRVRVSAKSNHIGDADRLLNGVPAVTDIEDKMRMDALERTIRALTETLGQRSSGAVSHHGGDVANGANGSWSNGTYSGEHEDVYYLVSRIERNVNAKFSELSRTWSVLGERLDALEHALREFDIELGSGGLTPEIEARLKTLTFAHERLDTLHELLTSVSDRLSDLNTGEGRIELAPVMTGINDVEAGLRGIGGQLREIDSRTGDVSLTIEEVNSRNKHLESLLEQQQDQIDGLKSFIRDEVVGQISVSGGGVDGDLIGRLFENSLKDMNETFDRQRESMAGLVNRAVAERFTAIQLPGRMARIEEHMKEAAERPVFTGENGNIDVAVVNDTVSKILTNQDRMASVIEDMNSASKTELSALRARLDTFDFRSTDSQATSADFHEINQQLKDLRDQIQRPQVLHPQPVQPTDSWTRLKLWLFGTSDWYAASWDNREEAGVWRPPGRDSATTSSSEHDIDRRV